MAEELQTNKNTITITYPYKNMRDRLNVIPPVHPPVLIDYRIYEAFDNVLGANIQNQSYSLNTFQKKTQALNKEKPKNITRGEFETISEFKQRGLYTLFEHNDRIASSKEQLKKKYKQDFERNQNYLTNTIFQDFTKHISNNNSKYINSSGSHYFMAKYNVDNNYYYFYTKNYLLAKKELTRDEAKNLNDNLNNSRIEMTFEFLKVIREESEFTQGSEIKLQTKESNPLLSMVLIVPRSHSNKIEMRYDLTTSLKMFDMSDKSRRNYEQYRTILFPTYTDNEDSAEARVPIIANSLAHLDKLRIINEINDPLSPFYPNILKEKKSIEELKNDGFNTRWIILMCVVFFIFGYFVDPAGYKRAGFWVIFTWFFIVLGFILTRGLALLSGLVWGGLIALLIILYLVMLVWGYITNDSILIDGDEAWYLTDIKVLSKLARQPLNLKTSDSLPLNYLVRPELRYSSDEDVLTHSELTPLLYVEFLCDTSLGEKVIAYIPNPDWGGGGSSSLYRLEKGTYIENQYGHVKEMTGEGDFVSYGDLSNSFEEQYDQKVTSYDDPNIKSYTVFDHRTCRPILGYWDSAYKDE